MQSSVEMSGGDVAVSSEPAMSLVEVEEGLAVLFADEIPEDLDVVPFGIMNAQTGKALADKVALAAGLGNVAAQGAQGAVAAQGLVKLAPQTLEALKAAKPMMSEGWNLGALVGENGKIAAQIRWAPAAGAQSAQVLSSLGPAGALLALQVQLASISRRVDENIELTRDVLQAIHQDQWATLLGLYETTMRAVREAKATGVVNDHIFTPLATRDADLRKQKRLFSSFVREHVAALDTDAQNRRAYIEKSIERIFADVHGMLMAEGSWYRAQVLRAAHISRDEANAAENENLLTELVTSSKREHEQAMDEIERLLATLERHCNLMVELPGEFSLPFSSKRRSVQDTAAMAGALAERVAELRERHCSKPAELDPTLRVFHKSAPENLLRILRWAVPGDEPLLALADVNLDRFVGDNAYLGVTPTRFFVSRQSSVRKQGMIDDEFLLDDIRYVRFVERGKSGPALDIITAEENLRLTFDDWARTGPELESARRLSDVLATAMNLPDSEKRTDPLLSERATRELEGA